MNITKLITEIKEYAYYPPLTELPGDRPIVSNASHMADALAYAMMFPPQPPVRKSWWRRNVVRRWDEVKRRAVNAWAALRGDWERGYDY